MTEERKRLVWRRLLIGLALGVTLYLAHVVYGVIYIAGTFGEGLD